MNSGAGTPDNKPVFRLIFNDTGDTYYHKDVDDIVVNDESLTDETCGLMSTSIRGNKLRESIKNFNKSYNVEFDDFI